MADFNQKSRAAYNKKADDYDNTRDGRFTREFKRLLVSEIVLSEKCNVLDVACGNGSLLAALSKKVPIYGYGIDISERMIANAIVNNPSMEFHTAGCEAMPFNDESMDLITVCAAYHHFPDVVAFAWEVKRVIRHNGILYIAEIYFPSFLRFIVNPFIPLSTEGDVKFYSPKEISRNFDILGFSLLDVKIYRHVQIVSMRA